MISWHRSRHSEHSRTPGNRRAMRFRPNLPTAGRCGATTIAVASLRCLPQKLHLASASSSGASRVHRLDRTSPFGNNLVGEVSAPLADEHAGASDQSADPTLGRPTEAARPVRLAVLDGALPRAGVHDLMDPLVAQSQFLGDLPQRCPGSMEAPDGVLVADLGLIGLALQVEQPVPGLARLPKEILIEGHRLLW
jgi:ribosomal protein L34E